MDVITELDLLDIILLIGLAALEESQIAKEPRSTGQARDAYLTELLNCGNEKRIYSILRMKLDTFEKLCSWLQTNTSL